MLTFGVALLVAGAQETALERLQASAPQVKRWGGALLLVVGTWIFLLGLFANAFVTVFPV